MEKELNRSAPICQSCGMPLAAREHFGTNRDDSPNRDYCCFCLQKGSLKDDYTLEEKIVDNLRYHDPAEPRGGRIVTRREEELRLRALLPTLQRWKKHTRAHDDYYRSVNTAVEYIQARLHTPLSLGEIASEAGLSMFHFHRIFRAVLGETPDEYIRRLKLERAAFLLHTTSEPVGEIAQRTGYDPASFTKAFRRQFGATPSSYRKKPGPLSVPLEEPPVPVSQPEIRELPSFIVNYVRVQDPFTDPEAFRNSWRSLASLTGAEGVPGPDEQYLLLARDNSVYTDSGHYRAYACLRLPKALAPAGRLGRMRVEGGRFAVFTHTGPYTELERLYCSIYRYWIPRSPYRLRDCSGFEKFLNSPDHSPDEEPVTEIYVPVERSRF